MAQPEMIDVEVARGIFRKGELVGVGTRLSLPKAEAYELVNAGKATIAPAAKPAAKTPSTAPRP